MFSDPRPPPSEPSRPRLPSPDSLSEKNSNPSSGQVLVAPGHYETIVDLEKISASLSFKLGLFLTATTVEIDLLMAEADRRQIITRLELSGKKFDTRTIEYAGYKIMVSKPDRGKLLFLLKDSGINNPHSVFVNSTSRPGGINVTFNTRKLEASGAPMTGASNQSSVPIFISRAPSHTEDLEILHSTLSSEQYRLKGLMDSDSARDFCLGMKEIYAVWKDLRPREKILQIRLLCNRILMQSGVYPCYFPELYIANWQTFSPERLSRFTPHDWSIHRSADFIEKVNPSEKEKQTFACSLYRELRHAEQTWLTLRYLAGRYPALLASVSFEINVPAVAELARQFPISNHHKSAALCIKIFNSFSIKPDKQKHRQYLQALVMNKTKLSLMQKVLAGLGQPYLFHDLDAVKAAGLVKSFW